MCCSSQKVWIKISGIDISEEMMDVCLSKGICEELKILDLRNDDFSFENESFNHVIAIRIFHFIENLDLIFKKTWFKIEKKLEYPYHILLYKKLSI